MLSMTKHTGTFGQASGAFSQLSWEGMTKHSFQVLFKAVTCACAAILPRATPPSMSGLGPPFLGSQKSISFCIHLTEAAQLQQPTPTPEADG